MPPGAVPRGRVALTLRLVGGLTVEEMAQAYVVPAATIAQRIVRAKRTIADKRIPYTVPDGPELARRLDSVLDVICLIFSEGYEATAGDAWLRIDLVEEGLRLARVLAGLLPEKPEVHGLAALLELQASRAGARSTPDLAVVLLHDQDRSRWDRLLIRRGYLAPQRAHELNARPAARPGGSPCRPRSRPSTRSPGRRTTPTGRAWPGCTRSWRRGSLLRSSS